MTLTALATAEPPERNSSLGPLYLVPLSGTDGTDRELDALIERAEETLMIGQRVMADLASALNAHHARKRHVQEVAADCEQRIIDTGQTVMKELEERLAEVKDDEVCPLS